MAARRSKHAASGAAPIVTLTTDFGTRDPFVGIMKGVILAGAPAARLVDLTHQVPPQNVIAGAYALASAARWFPARTIHVAVVDPGVGTRRRALLIETADAWFVGPDNGVLSLAVSLRAARRIFDISRSRVRLRPTSRTFHGRDVFAPVAAALAAGADPARLGTPVRTIARLRPPTARRANGRITGEVLWVDGYGNLTTNVGRVELGRTGFRGRRLSITIGAHVVPLRASYGSVRPDRAVAVVNSSDLLEIAVNHGSAAERFEAGPGTRISVGVT
jgi:S-adenosylmethionine hydrolase